MPVEFGKALYFPYIELWDRVEWLKVAALYHDKICRIVPPKYTTSDPDDVKAFSLPIIFSIPRRERA